MSDVKSSCGSKEVTRYELIKCKTCGKIIKDFAEGLKKGWRLKILYNKKEGEICIRGNKSGLEFLASCCLHIIGKNDPSGHIHLQWQMNNLEEGSTETVLVFSEEPEDYKK